MSVDIQKIKSEIRSYILENFLFGYRENELLDNTSFLEIGVLDSMGIMELVAYLQREYGISVSDEEIIPENLGSVDCVTKFLLKKCST
ncbi:Acyl carrier protein [Gammaproteobacteria bacterium]